MKRLNYLLRQPEFHLLVCFASFILFNGPAIGLLDQWCLGTVFLCLFLLWAMVIFVMFLIGRSLARDRSAQDNQRGSPC